MSNIAGFSGVNTGLVWLVQAGLCFVREILAKKVRQRLGYTLMKEHVINVLAYAILRPA